MSSKAVFDAACTGNVEVLHKLLEENPLVLTDFALSYPRESLLHIATKAGQLDFVRELINHDHELAKELSRDGFRPLDIASMMGNVELVKELLKNDPGICRLKGKDQRTALHHAAMKGRIQVIDELFYTCPECVVDITIHGETALHLAVESNQFDAFQLLVRWLERISMETIINWGDCDENTVLHLAASRKQENTVGFMLSNNNTISGVLEVNAKNLKGFTAMDILDIVMESPKDLHLKEILQRAGAFAAQHANAVSETSDLQHFTGTEQAQHELQSKTSKDWFKYFKFQFQKDSPTDARNALLVVAALIATVTFQAGVNPPLGIVKSTNQSNSDSTAHYQQDIAPVENAGIAIISAIVGSHATTLLFLFANTLGFTASLSLIIYLTGGFPFQMELLISIFSLMFAYGFLVSKISKEAIAYVLQGIAFTIPFVLRWLPRWGRKVWKCRHKLPLIRGRP